MNPRAVVMVGILSVLSTHIAYADAGVRPPERATHPAPLAVLRTH